MPRLRLPPLPSPKLWPAYFSKRGRTYDGSTLRELSGRLNLANPRLCDQFVRDVGIRDNEVVVEIMGSYGSLTRSLASGGQSSKEEDDAIKAEWVEATKDLPRPTKKAAKASGRRPASFFPSWIETFGSVDPEAKVNPFADEPREYLPEQSGLKKPVVVANLDAAGAHLQQGFDAQLSSTVPFPTEVTARYQDDHVHEGLEVCKYDERIVLAYGDPYFYETLEKTIAHPLVNKHLPIVNPDAEDEHSKRYRKWTDEAPPLTVVWTVPPTDLGDQMIGSLITSALGSSEGKAGYIWKYGRVRVALLVSRFVYDRMMAKPGELCISKPTIYLRGLFNIRPVAPYHHVPNVGRRSLEVEAVPLRKSQQSELCSKLKEEIEKTDRPRTITYPEDFYPKVTRVRTTNDQPVSRTRDTAGKDPKGLSLPRTPMLGVVLEPRLDSPMSMHQRDEWDYVLRHCMVLSAQPLRDALPMLGFNGVSLVADIEGNGPYAGRPVDCNTMVRELDVEDWARVVDVFYHWPFKPSVIVMDKDLGLVLDS